MSRKVIDRWSEKAKEERMKQYRLLYDPEILQNNINNVSQRGAEGHQRSISETRGIIGKQMPKYEKRRSMSMERNGATQQWHSIMSNNDDDEVLKKRQRFREIFRKYLNSGKRLNLYI